MNKEAIAQLVELAQRDQDAIPPVLGDPHVAWSLLHPQEMWKEVGLELPEEQLRLLIQGLVHYNRAGRPTGGSVSPVIPLFYCYARRFPENEPSLTHWVVAHRRNPWEPFGSMVGNDARSMTEHRERREIRWATARRNEEAERIRRRIDRARAVREHVATTARNTQERADLLKALAGLPLPDRLQALLRDQNRALSWFPETWANEATVNVAIVDPLLRDGLVKRLTGYRKGPWRQLREALIAARQNG